MKRKLSLLLVLTMLIGMITLTGCGKEAGNLIGVAMPTQSLQRWNQDGENMKKELKPRATRWISVCKQRRQPSDPAA